MLVGGEINKTIARHTLHPRQVPSLRKAGCGTCCKLLKSHWWKSRFFRHVRVIDEKDGTQNLINRHDNIPQAPRTFLVSTRSQAAGSGT